MHYFYAIAATRGRRATHRSWPHASDGLLRTLNPKWCRQSRILRLLPSVTLARFCCGDRDGFDSARASANSFSCRSSRFCRCRHTYGMARQQDKPQVGQASAPAARSAATDLPRSRSRSFTTWASCRQTTQTSQCFASRNHRFNWSGSRGRLPTLRVATKRFISYAVCCEWSVSVPFRADERAGSTRTGAGLRLCRFLLSERGQQQMHCYCHNCHLPAEELARRALLAFLNVGRLK